MTNKNGMDTVATINRDERDRLFRACAGPIVPPRQSVIDTAIRFTGLFLLSFATTGTERLAEPRRLKAEPFRPLVQSPNFLQSPVQGGFVYCKMALTLGAFLFV